MVYWGIVVVAISWIGYLLGVALRPLDSGTAAASFWILIAGLVFALVVLRVCRRKLEEKEIALIWFGFGIWPRVLRRRKIEGKQNWMARVQLARVQESSASDDSDRSWVRATSARYFSGFRIVKKITQVRGASKAATRPNLLDLLVRDLDAAKPAGRLATTGVEFTQIAMVAGYLFEQSTLIGRLTREHPTEITQLVRADLSHAGWERYHNDYEGAETLRAAKQFAYPSGFLEEVAKRRPSISMEELAAEFDDLQRELAGRLIPSMYFLQTEWPEVYAPGAAMIDNRRWAARIEQRWTMVKASAVWAQACAQGLAFGLFFPARADQMLNAAFASPDATKWAQARADGLNVSPTPADRDMAETSETLLAAVRALAAEHYPEVAAVLDDRFASSDKGVDSGA